MMPHTEAIGRIVSYAASIGYDYNGWTGNEGVNYISISAGGVHLTIACWPDQDYFTAVSTRRVSNIEGLDVDDSVPYVEAKEMLKESAVKHTDPEVRMEPLIEQVQNDAVEYLDGIKARSFLFVYEDQFTMSQFDEKVQVTDEACRSVFFEIVDAYDLELDLADEAAVEDDEPARSAFH